MWDFLKKTDVPIDNFSKTWITWESEIAKLFCSPSIKAEVQDGKKMKLFFQKLFSETCFYLAPTAAVKTQVILKHLHLLFPMHGGRISKRIQGGVPSKLENKLVLIFEVNCTLLFTSFTDY